MHFSEKMIAVLSVQTSAYFSSGTNQVHHTGIESFINAPQTVEIQARGLIPNKGELDKIADKIHNDPNIQKWQYHPTTTSTQVGVSTHPGFWFTPTDTVASTPTPKTSSHGLFWFGQSEPIVDVPNWHNPHPDRPSDAANPPWHPSPIATIPPWHPLHSDRPANMSSANSTTTVAIIPIRTGASNFFNSTQLNSTTPPPANVPVRTGIFNISSLASTFITKYITNSSSTQPTPTAIPLWVPSIVPVVFNRTNSSTTASLVTETQAPNLNRTEILGVMAGSTEENHRLPMFEGPEDAWE